MKKLSYIIWFVYATASYALQGGPTQPDYIQFEPSDMKDMVSLLTGNFAYSIPLGEIPGAYGSYPLSLSYHAGISPQQEASWVGLGWTLNPGSIIRDVRGIPDDQFHGGTLGFIYQYSAMYTWALDLSFSNQVFSVGITSSNLGGTGVHASYGFDIGETAKLGFTISTTQGVGIDGGIGFGGRYGLNASVMFSPGSGDLTIGAGTSIYGADEKTGYKASIGVQYTTGQDVSFHAGMSLKSKDSKDYSNVIGASVRKNGTSVSLGNVSVSVANSPTKGGLKSSTTGFGIVVPTSWGMFSLGFNQTLHEYHMRSATSDYVYGYMYQGGPAIVSDGNNDISEIPDAQTGSNKSLGRIQWQWSLKGRSMETLGDQHMHPAYDMFTIESEGVAGTFRAFPREEHQLLNLLSNYATDEKKRVEHYSPILLLNKENHWPELEEFVYKNKGDLTNNEKEKSDYPSYKANQSVDAPFALYKTNFRNEGNRMVYRADKNSSEPLTSGLSFLFLGEGGYYESEIRGGAKYRDAGIVSDSLLKRTVDGKQYALYGSRKVEPIFEDNSPVGKIKGFVITNSNGTKYFFTQPVKSYLKVDYTVNQEKGTPVFVDKKSAKNKDFIDHLWERVKTILNPVTLFSSIVKSFQGHLDETCQPNKADETMLYSYQINMNPYATQWLLTEIQGPDYVELNKNDMSNNIGYNVKFNYTKKPILYQWRTPYAQPNVYAGDLPNFRVPRNGVTPEGCDTKMYQAAFGVKEYFYLESIETATHQAKFELNDPKTEERVDGKGWYFKKHEQDPNSKLFFGWVADNKKKQNHLPIFTTAALSLNVKAISNSTITKSDDYITLPSELAEKWHEATYSFDALYVNVEIPELLLTELQKNKKLFLETDYANKLTRVGSGNAVIFKENTFVVEFDVDSKIEKTSGEETKFGLYKIKLKKDKEKHFYWQNNSSGINLFNEAKNGKVKLVLAENGQCFVDGKDNGVTGDSQNNCELKQKKMNVVTISTNGGNHTPSMSNQIYIVDGDAKNLVTPIIDWSDIIFAGDQENPEMNQTRYLKKISYYKKKDKVPYREYKFEYDYSLHPKTLNSFCSSRYPNSNKDIQNSPDNADLGICSADTNSHNLYGKLTLKSITESGCQNGRCSSLPPFKFDYNAASQTSTRLSSLDAWMDLSEKNIPKWVSSAITSLSKIVLRSDDYYKGITDVDATIIASNNTTDEWGLWNNYANEDNHKTTQSFADYGAAAWSMNKVTDPAGGILEIKYERDVYRNGEDYSDENLYVPIYRIGKCSKMHRPSNFDPQYNNNICAQVLPMYWNDQCLGPRAAYWSLEKPKYYHGNDFDYMDKMGITTNGQLNENSTIYYNARSELNTDVSCGFLGLFDCDRFRNVGLFGSSKLLEMYEFSDKIIKGLPYYTWVAPMLGVLPQMIENKQTRLLVLNEKYNKMFAGLQIEAEKINNLQDWDILSINGNMWTKREYETIKGGDLRVKSLKRYDIDRIAKTEYEYDPGELAQLPDSAYNTILGNRFNVNVLSYAMPNVNIKPKSRIVGFNDDDLLYIPGSKIMYPKVTVKSSDSKEKIVNGKTEYEYITPEKGIPEEYIDTKTKKDLLPFIHVNTKLMVWNAQSYLSKIISEQIKFPENIFVVKFEFVNDNDSLIGEPMNVAILQSQPTSFNFYHKDVKSTKKIKTSYEYIKNGNKVVKEIGSINLDNMNDFNEVALTFAYINKKMSVSKNWERTQEKGFIPILYKQISYEADTTDQINFVDFSLDDLLCGNIVLRQGVNPLIEKKIVYHDFSAFLGMNTKNTIYRGIEDGSMLLRIDSNVFSTKVPDVLDGIVDKQYKNGKEIDVTDKIGLQVERWRSVRELQCIDADGECINSNRQLSISNAGSKINVTYPHDGKKHDMYLYQDSVSFEYIRYPVFQIATITSNGFDNQERQFDVNTKNSSSSAAVSSNSCDERCVRNKLRQHWTITENHKYDPITSTPTATVAKIPAIGGKELRKLTVKLPHHAVMSSSSMTDIAKYMFKRNMLSQNYADFVYFDSLPVNRTTSWNNLEKVKYLKSFSINPLNKLNEELVNSDNSPVESEKYPYIEWGSFTTKNSPVNIIPNGILASDDAPYNFVAQYQDLNIGKNSGKWPNEQDFLGNHILKVDRYFRVLESEDVFNRRLSAHYTSDGLHQTGIFFPAAFDKTASIVFNGEEIEEKNIKESFKNKMKVDINKGGMLVLSSVNLSCTVFDCDSSLVAEYRIKKPRQTWLTERIKMNEFALSLNSGDVLNYLRIYPENAEAKNYVYDRYGNIIQIIDKNNLSTFYEYNPFGQLIQVRDDDGVSYKSHHREFRNDDRSEIPYKSDSSSSGI